MLRCVKRKPNRNNIGERNGLGERNYATLPRERTHSEAGPDSDTDTAHGTNSANRPSRWSLTKKSATLSTTTPSNSIQTRSESRSSSKHKGFNMFRVGNWRTLSLSSLFSPSRKHKHTESSTASSSGFVSPTADTEPLTGSNSLERGSRHKRPQSIELNTFTHKKVKASDSGSEASTPTGMRSITDQVNVHEDQLRQLSSNAELSDTSDHTPTEPTAPTRLLEISSTTPKLPFVDANGSQTNGLRSKPDKMRKLHWVSSTEKNVGFPTEQPAKPEVTLKKSQVGERVTIILRQSFSGPKQLFGAEFSAPCWANQCSR
ncbi:Ankyrin [Fasciola gigantica]|uniref:Ankyrin n=1 Tax=Fasciola gigantica TaxID=46835 RepID=A0A504XRY6_FASGI|nr:Ankyrin [Fasciola gigantica]